MTPRAALEVHLKAWVDGQSVQLPVAWKNRGFDKPDGFYLEPRVMPAARAASNLCTDEESGLFQIGIKGPRDVDVGPFEVIAESLCAHFGGQHDGFQVAVPPYYSEGLNTDDGRFMVPVSIFYSAVA